MSKLLKIYEDRVASLKDQEAVLQKSCKKLWDDKNRLSLDLETGKLELQKISIEAEAKRNGLERELKEIRDAEEKRTLSIKNALDTRETTATEREKSVEIRENVLDSSIEQFLGFVDAQEKTLKNMVSREEELEEFAKSLHFQHRIFVAILDKISTISQSIAEGYTFARTALAVSENLQVDQEVLSSIIGMVRSDEKQITEQKKWISDEKIKITDQWAQLKQAKNHIS